MTVGPENEPSDAQAPTRWEILGRKLVVWRVIDSKFRQNKNRYFAQTFGAALAILVVLLLLDSVRQTVLIASLGASCFIAFAVPRSYPSRPRALVGGYLVGTVIGCAMSLLAGWIAAALNIDLHNLQIIFGALATGAAFFVMVVTSTEHPPAAALSLGYVLNEWDPTTIVVVLAGILVLSVLKEVLRPRLMDLM